MAKIDAYFRSIERFGATGAVLSSGKSVTLRFPSGDRHATQVISHEALVALIREVAPPVAHAALEAGRATRFVIESGGAQFSLLVTPRPGDWHVAIEVGAPEPPAAASPSPPPRAASPVALAEPARVEPPALAIERTPYEEPRAAAGPPGALLARLLSWARAHDAWELWLATGAPVMARVGGSWISAGEQTLDAELVARELGVIAPAAVRAAYLERGEGAFSTFDDAGRVRVAWARDQAGPRAIIRFLRPEPPSAEQVGLPRPALSWLRAARGLVIVAGRPGSGKTTAIAALVRELVAAGTSTCALEDPLEIVQPSSALVSQREVGTHVPTFAAGVRAAMREGISAIVLSRCEDAETAAAIGAALDAGHFVIAEVGAASSASALARFVGLLPQGERAREAIAEGLRGVLISTLAPHRERGVLAAFEVVPGGPPLTRVVLEQHWSALPELLASQRAAGAISLEEAVTQLVQRGLVAPPT